MEDRRLDFLKFPFVFQIAQDHVHFADHQLASLGSPILDRLLSDAAERWRSSRFYRVGLNLLPHGLEARLQRAISLPQTASLSIEKVRAMNFPQALFRFKATFAGDQKEEEILPIGIDLHYLREVRHLKLLLMQSRLSEEPQANVPEAPHAGLMAGYRAARKQVAPTVASLANARRREWTARVEKQIARMGACYSQLRHEADEHVARSAGSTRSDPERAAARRDAIDREERLRTAELKQKSAVHVAVKLASTMIVIQPKLLVSAAIFDKERPVGRLDVVWIR
jgi:hypothetical protein